MNIIQYENYQEKREQDPSGFPYLTYPCTIPLDFSKVPLHWHDEMEFIYIKKGTGLVSVDFVPYEVHGGDIIVVSLVSFIPSKSGSRNPWSMRI